MRGEVNRLLLVATGLLAVNASGASFNSEFLDHSGKGASKGAGVAPKGAEPAGPARKNVAVEEQHAADYSAALNYETIESLTQLLKTTAPGPVRNRLLLNRAAAMNLYARKRHLASKQSKIDEQGRKFLEAAIRDSTEILNGANVSPEDTQRARYLIGFSHLYMDETKKARDYFVEVLRSNPNVENSGWMGLFIAEDLFDEAKYDEAIRYYSAYFPRMSQQGKELALYKTAWCHINLSRSDKAEEIFLQVVRTKSRQGLARDSLRDLAYLIAHRQDPSPAIRQTEALLTQADEKIEFLNAVRANMEAQGLVALHAEVVARLLQLETQPERRLELLLADLRVNRKLFASHDHLAAFRKVDSFARESKLTGSSPVIRKFESLLETELLALLKAFMDTYAGRTKTPEKFERKELGQALKGQFIFFSWYLLNSQVRPMVVNLWLDVCVESKDWGCVDMAGELVLTDRARLGQFAERAHLDLLAALEELSKTSEGQKKAEYDKRRSVRMRQFIEAYPASEQWLRVARLFAQLEVEAGKHKETVSLLDRIYAKDPTPDSYYRLQFARFEAKDHAGLLDDPRNAKFAAPEPRLRELWRESCLVLAQQSRESGDIPGYRKHIRKFLELQPEQSKGRVAREDYFRFLLQKERPEIDDDVLVEFLALPAEERADPSFDEVRNRLWHLSMERAKFREALELLNGVKAPNVESTRGQELAFKRMLSKSELGLPISSPELLELAAANREYFLGLFALVRPDTALAHFRETPPRTTIEKDLALLALQMKTGSWVVRKTPESVRLLGAGHAFAPSEEESPLLGFEKRIQQLKFPRASSKPAALAKAVQALIGETQSIRSQVPKQIQGKTPGTQLRAIESARDLEKRIAEMVLNSPVPNELSPEQVQQYRQGLEGVAKEFTEQSQEFDRIAATIREGIEKARAAIQARLIPVPRKMSDWKWPSIYTSEPALKAVSGVAAAGNVLGALALLDFHRAQKIKSPEDFFRIRAGILLSSPHPETLRIYLLNELENNQQNEIIEEWRKAGA